jgi:hypothetical protein
VPQRLQTYGHLLLLNCRAIGNWCSRHRRARSASITSIDGITGSQAISKAILFNANDFWGSVTLGFVFQWLGVTLLEKLPGVPTGSSPEPSTWTS